MLKIDNITVVKDILLDSNRFIFYDKYSHANGYKNYAKFKKTVRFFTNKITNKTIKIEKGIWISDTWSGNYYHWFMDCIPRLLMAENYLDDHVVIIPERFQSYSFIKESLAFLRRKAIYVKPNINYKVSHALLPSEIGKIGQYRIELLVKLKEKFVKDADTVVGKRKVFIMRRPAKARNIINKEPMIEILNEFQYEIHYFEDYNLLKQIDIIKETKILVGIHGAGLTNMVFMPKGGTVLEFRNEEDGSKLVNCFFTLAAELGLHYFYTTNKSTDKLTNKGDFDIDLLKLKKTLKLLDQIKS
ncbi:glycosyltransferase family 61 protein [Cognataquiflexum aquatile]|uniref:glycosyltransferase family 61 protein n=1 Tax=Cognataquiflexum aquatile TaxID=2249427 RepID=UPI0013007A68|nr:glycosyltransferase family 61 protein [Cognataquiflexum aquatile]